MKLQSLCVLFLVFLILNSCTDTESKRKATLLENENLKLQQELRAQEQEKENQIQRLSEIQNDLEKQIEEQKQRDELEANANNIPLELKNISTYNGTYEGSVLNSSDPFEKSSIRYIWFKVSGVNNVAKLGKVLYGKIYVRYLDISGELIGNKDYFYTRSGDSKDFSFSIEVNSSNESFSTGKAWGNKYSSVYTYPGIYKIEIWFDPFNENKAYKCISTSFEVY